MSIRNVQHVFDAAAFKLSTDGLLDDDVVGLLRRQDLIDLLGGSQGINLVRLQRRKNRENFNLKRKNITLFHLSTVGSSLLTLHSHLHSASAD